MSTPLLQYFDRELSHLRKAGVEFARRYPRIARQLELSSTGSADPHVERLLEGFAFLTARIHKKLDDDQTHITEALLDVVAPHYLSPFPSCSLIQLASDVTEGRHTERHLIPRGTLVSSRPVKGNPCIFRTCFETEVWPLVVSGARLGSPSDALAPPPKARTALTVELKSLQNIRFRELNLSRLRFYLHGPDRRSFALYEHLLTCVTRVDLIDPDTQQVLSVLPAASVLRPSGFEPDESLLMETPQLQSGPRLLMEYFAFPQKFRFVEVSGLEQAVKQVKGQRLSLVFYSEVPASPQLEGLEGSLFRLGCTPIVNLFPKQAEPITVKHTEPSYRVIPDRHRQRFMEVYRVSRVRGVLRGSQEAIEYRPFYSLAHQDRHAEAGRAYWYANRQTSHQEGDDGTELNLSFVTLGFQEAVPQAQAVLVDILCTNRDLPEQLPIHEDQTGDFHLQQGSVGEIRCLVKPTATLRLPQGRGLQWRLISTLAVHHTTLTDPEQGLSALKEVLRLHDFRNSQATEQQIAGLVRISSQPVAGRVRLANGADGVARGFDVTLELDPTHFVGASPLLFGGVLERYLASMMGLNAFSKVTLRLKNQEGSLFAWAPRAGARPLI